ncbi:protein YgfX [Ectothiorhodospira mobilis]|uniref:protein YgfX n=1 Tax=Ectothiorhodospira mobilis TaxID=195064 RepID=UPI001908E94C|nr:protein YgfX [Ectothiorhodospira mobilis]MBK1690565.1 hypothetical protein [Ectothiorhodospira mobilis]
MAVTSHAAGLRVEVGISRVLLAGLCALHLGAALALGVSALATWLRGMGLVLVAASLVREWLRYAGPRRITAIGCDAGGGWWLEMGGRRQEVAVLPETTVIPGCVLLCLRDARGRHRRCPLLADAVAADALRRLRGRLRTAGGGTGG